MFPREESDKVNQRLMLVNALISLKQKNFPMAAAAPQATAGKLTGKGG